MVIESVFLADGIWWSMALLVCHVGQGSHFQKVEHTKEHVQEESKAEAEAKIGAFWAAAPNDEALSTFCPSNGESWLSGKEEEMRARRWY